MKINILALAAELSDHDLVTRLPLLAANEREATAELLAHLSALDTRPSLYAAHGYGSLFAYCTQALRLSEDATCNRIEAARACRRFPPILDQLAQGALSLTSVRLLGRHLTPGNHVAVLARASGKSRREIEALVAELAPQPDIPASVRKLPTPTARAIPQMATRPLPDVVAPSAAVEAPLPLRPPARPVVQAAAPARYRVQLTIGEETHDKLRRVQALLRREIPDGDPAAILDRALTVLLEKVERTKLGGATKPRPRRAAIRPGTDGAPASRHIPRDVKHAVCRRDGGRCAFVSKGGVRCTERTFLEFHHRQPHALGGPVTAENIALRCWRHNQYEAEVDFGSRGHRSPPAGHTTVPST
jgi:hypothetical protein